MESAKKAAAVAVGLFLALMMVVAVTMASQVFAAESEAADAAVVSEQPVEVGETSSAGDSDSPAKQEGSLAVTEATTLTAQTEAKPGFPRFLGFLLVLATAAGVGILVWFRARLGEKPRCYDPEKDLTIFKMK